MNQVVVNGSYITIRELVLVDDEAARALAEVNEPEQPDTVTRALRVGLLLMRDVVPIAKADFVRKEFAKLKDEMEGYWREEVRQKIEQALARCFDGETGALPAALRDYLGDGGGAPSSFHLLKAGRSFIMH